MKDKTDVINDPLGQAHSHASSEHCFLLFCFSRFEKCTDGQRVRKQLYLPEVTWGWPSGSKKALKMSLQYMVTYCYLIL